LRQLGAGLREPVQRLGRQRQRPQLPEGVQVSIL
jgi:hypothetical protein